MRGWRSTSVLALALCLAWGLAAPASAQITTGAVTGTVTDAQGGVIPGATVILVSETQGTKSAPVVTNARRSVRHPERHRGHLHRSGDDERLQDACRDRASGSAAATACCVETLVLQVGGTTENVTVTAESPIIQAATGERSSALHAPSAREPAGRDAHVPRLHHDADRRRCPTREPGRPARRAAAARTTS